MDYKKYLEIPNASIPDEIKKTIKNKGGITKTLFENKNDILVNNELKYECGYEEIDDYYLVSMYTPMPKVTKEMVDWWFWWHPQDSIRYKSWYPGEHKGISYSKKNKLYFSNKEVPIFENNTQYPVEKVGKLYAPLSIDFVTPEEFGYDLNLMKENDVETIVCGHVGAFKGRIPNTEMSHIFFKDKDGLLLVSRFWLGKLVKSKFLKKKLVTEEQAKCMAEHCCVEYRNFALKIPQMYNEWLEEDK
ncbi:MAG: hypothetical protein R3Y64_10905 [Peptostreptococcaceae bacterium]